MPTCRSRGVLESGPKLAARWKERSAASDIYITYCAPIGQRRKAHTLTNPPPLSLSLSLASLQGPGHARLLSQRPGHTTATLQVKPGALFLRQQLFEGETEDLLLLLGGWSKAVESATLARHQSASQGAAPLWHPRAGAWALASGSEGSPEQAGLERWVGARAAAGEAL
jgi:hypothetical protein